MKRSGYAVLLLLIQPTILHSSTVERQTNAYLDMFFSVCADANFTVSEAEEVASLRGWDSLPDLILLARQPDANDVVHKGWVATIEEFIDIPVFWVVTSVKAPEGVFVDTCSLYMRTISQAELMELFEDEYSSRMVGDEMNGPDRTLMFLEHDSINQFFTLAFETNSPDGRGAWLGSTFIRENSQR